MCINAFTSNKNDKTIFEMQALPEGSLLVPLTAVLSETMDLECVGLQCLTGSTKENQTFIVISKQYTELKKSCFTIN